MSEVERYIAEIHLVRNQLPQVQATRRDHPTPLKSLCRPRNKLERVRFDFATGWSAARDMGGYFA
jgi:hypothetical protein